MVSKTNRHEEMDTREQVPVVRENSIPDRPSVQAKRPVIVSHPIARHALSVLRDKNTSGRQLRHYSQQLLTIGFHKVQKDLLRQLAVAGSAGGQEQ